jgi:hypothetical protein
MSNSTGSGSHVFLRVFACTRTFSQKKLPLVDICFCFALTMVTILALLPHLRILMIAEGLATRDRNTGHPSDSAVDRLSA